MVKSCKLFFLAMMFWNNARVWSQEKFIQTLLKFTSTVSRLPQSGAMWGAQLGKLE
jgi:hypothetical protein